MLKIDFSRKILQIIKFTVLVLIVLNVIDSLTGNLFWQITRLIHLEEEANFTTWLSSMMLAIAGFYAYQCSLESALSEKRIWEVLSGGFILMSCDEVAQIHENLGNTINKYFFNLKSIEHSAWIVLLGPIILAVIFIILIKLNKVIKESKKARKYLFLGCGIYIFGAFMLEALTIFLNHEVLGLLWNIEIILEGALELIGVVFMLQGLMEHYNYLVYEK